MRELGCWCWVIDRVGYWVELVYVMEERTGREEWVDRGRDDGNQDKIEKIGKEAF